MAVNMAQEEKRLNDIIYKRNTEIAQLKDELEQAKGLLSEAESYLVDSFQLGVGSLVKEISKVLEVKS